MLKILIASIVVIAGTLPIKDAHALNFLEKLEKELKKAGDQISKDLNIDEKDNNKEIETHVPQTQSPPPPPEPNITNNSNPTDLITTGKTEDLEYYADGRECFEKLTGENIIRRDVTDRFIEDPQWLKGNVCIKDTKSKFLQNINVKKIIGDGEAYAIKSNANKWTYVEVIDKITDEKKAIAKTKVKTDKNFEIEFEVTCSESTNSFTGKKRKDPEFYFSTNQIFVTTKITQFGQIAGGRRVIDKTPSDTQYTLKKGSLGEFSNYSSLQVFDINGSVVFATQHGEFGAYFKSYYYFPYRIGFELQTLRGIAFVNVPLYDKNITAVLANCTNEEDRTLWYGIRKNAPN
jgi:hypothetical protein